MRGVLRGKLSRTFAMMALALPSPLIMGDFPDPSVIFAEGEHVAVTTGGGWAPTMRVLRSPDLTNWRLSGDVLQRRPKWAKSSFWAPEITRLASGGYAVYYSAAHRREKKGYCLGVATAPSTEGPWRDLGRPLRCGRYGLIDSYPTRDEQGRLHLLYKSDGNAFGKPTPIYAQRLREDGRRLFGPAKELLRNSPKTWERKVIEAPHVYFRPEDGYFYMLYSGALCCSKRCAYGIGVARSKTLLGRWRKFEGNPIVTGGNGWRCPGHATIADGGPDGPIALYHAYRAGADRIVGRQLLAAPITFRSDGWPMIGDGRPPVAGAGAPGIAFSDDFSSRQLALDWERPLEDAPSARSGKGLRLTASRAASRRPDAAVLSRRVGDSRYDATAVIDRGALRGPTTAGVSAWRNPNESISIAVGRGETTVWRRFAGRARALGTVPTPAAGAVHVRMVARGLRFAFDVSRDGTNWRRVAPASRLAFDDSMRLALIAGGRPGASARFISAALAPAG
jgi:beta-xylosidase